MSPEVERIGNCTLYRGDALEVLPMLGPVDAVVTDPPYGVGFSYASYEDSPGLHAAHCQEWLLTMRKIAPKVFVFTGIRNLFLWPQPDWIVAWHKDFCMGRSPFGSNNWEPVAVYGKGRRGERQSDFFSAPTVALGRFDHPCPKPEKAMRELVRIASRARDHLLDPFMGSGTTGVACTQLGRVFTGIEIEPRYFDLACRRIDEVYRQLTLFPSLPTPVPPRQEVLAL